MISAENLLIFSLYTADIAAYGDYSARNFKAYAAKFGFSCRITNKADPSRPPAWSKISLAQEMIASNKYDWLFWIDADAVITNPEIDVRSFIDDDYDLIIGGKTVTDEMRINTGVWLLRSCSRSMDFLTEVWNWTGDRYNRFWEQKAASDVLFGKPGIIRHKLVPRTEFNSSLRLWRPGQFIRHFSGDTHENRVTHIPSMVDEVERLGECRSWVGKVDDKEIGPMTPLEKIKYLDKLRAASKLPPISHITDEELDKIDPKDVRLNRLYVDHESGEVRRIKEPKTARIADVEKKIEPVVYSVESSTQETAGPIPCCNRGLPTGQVARCKSCKGRVDVKVSSCAVYGTCTTHRKVDGYAHCNQFCPSLGKRFESSSVDSKNITVVSLYSSDISAYADAATDSLKRYADMHGYECVISKTVDPDRPASWSKIPLVLDLMENSDREWIFWIDADAVITRPSIPLQNFIVDGMDFIATDDPPATKESPFSMGVWFARNCDEMKNFFKLIWHWNGNKLNPWWEQAAAHEIFNSGAVPGLKYVFRPRTTFNSYINEWHHSHFVCHFAGVTHEARCMRIPDLVKNVWLPFDLRAGSTTGWFDYRDFYSAEAEHVPPDSVAVELGCWLGRSTIHLADTVKHKNVKIHAIDTWDLIERTAKDGLVSDHRAVDSGVAAELAKFPGMTQREIFENNVRFSGHENDIEIVSGDSAKSAKKFPNESVDFVFIDANHNYPAVKRDIESWLPKLKHGGVISGHDYSMDSVRAAVDELLPDATIDHTGKKCWRYQKLAPSYVICFTQRSGSTLLAYTLADLGFGNPDEYFEPVVRAETDEEHRFQPRTPEQKFRDFQRLGHRNGISGVKTVWKQFVPVKDIILTRLPECRYIFLTRRNIVRQAVSKVIAAQTRVWTSDSRGGPSRKPAMMTRAAIESEIITMVKEKEQWELFFEENGITPLRLAYESLDSHYEETVRHVCRFIDPDQPVDTIPPARVKKLATELNEEWFLAVVKH